MKIGMIGAGAMANPMARNLLKAGHAVAVYNRTRARAENLAADGATVVDTVRQACEGADVIISMLADDAAMDAVFGDMVAAMGETSVHVAMSTISIAIVQRMTEQHSAANQGFVSAPVFGRPDAAAAASLSILAAGPVALLDRLQPIFEALGKKIFRIGEVPFHSNILKLCGNGMLLSAIEGLAETMALVRKHGMSAEQFLDVMTNTLLTAPFYKSYGSLMVQDALPPTGFRLILGRKDASLLLDAGAAVGLAMPEISTVRQRIEEAAANGYAEEDISTLAASAFRGPRQ